MAKNVRDDSHGFLLRIEKLIVHQLLVMFHAFLQNLKVHYQVYDANHSSLCKAPLFGSPAATSPYLSIYFTNGHVHKYCKIIRI